MSHAHVPCQHPHYFLGGEITPNIYLKVMFNLCTDIVLRFQIPGKMLNGDIKHHPTVISQSKQLLRINWPWENNIHRTPFCVSSQGLPKSKLDSQHVFPNSLIFWWYFWGFRFNGGTTAVIIHLHGIFPWTSKPSIFGIPRLTSWKAPIGYTMKSTHDQNHSSPKKSTMFNHY